MVMKTTPTTLSVPHHQRKQFYTPDGKSIVSAASAAAAVNNIEESKKPDLVSVDNKPKPSENEVFSNTILVNQFSKRDKQPLPNF